MNAPLASRSLGRYELLGELGRGAMGAVYQARDPRIDRIVAIKTIATASLPDAEAGEYRERFYQEARAAGRLSHPGIVAIYDIAEEESTRTPYLVMEYVPGQTLDSLIRGDGSAWPLARKLGLVAQVADALDYAHRENVVHRDIKPANILVTSDGRAKITDFGVARLAMSQMTVAGQIMGTPAYMSPEQLAATAVDGRSDLFSLGVILYWMATGTMPFPGESLTQIAFHVAYKDPPRVSELNPGLPDAWNAVLSRALAKKPEERYQTGQEFAADLQQLQQGRLAGIPARETNSQAEAEKTVIRAVLAARSDLPIREALAPAARPAAGWILQWFGRDVGLLKDSRWCRALLRWTEAAGRAFVRVVWRRPARRNAFLAGTLGMIFIFTADLMTRPILSIRAQHPFSAAVLTISADRQTIYRASLNPLTTRKGIRVVFTDRERVSPGKHILAVRVTAPEEDYEETREVPVRFSRLTQSTLIVGFRRSGFRRNEDLYVEWKDSAGVPAIGRTTTGQQQSGIAGRSDNPLYLAFFGGTICALLGWLAPAAAARLRDHYRSTRSREVKVVDR